MTTCLYPDPAEYPDDEYPPEHMGTEWRTSETCSHDWCAEVAGWQRQWAAERPYRESMALAREDLDMAHASEPELMEAIQWQLK